MFRLDTAHTINAIVDGMLRGKHFANRDKSVVFFTLRLEVAEDRSSDPVDIRYVHLLYYTKDHYVLVGLQTSKSPLIPDHHTWKQVSYHDSCWRSDGTRRSLHEACFEMCKSAFPDIAPIELHTTADLHSIQFREVTDVHHKVGEMIRLKFPSPAT
jgi:hypothetical protein